MAVLLASSFLVNASLADSSVLLLEVWINGRTGHQVLRMQSFDGELYIAPLDLVRSGLRLDEAETHGLIAMHGLRGVSFKIDPVNQRLLIAASADRLPVQVFDLRPSITAFPQSTSARGALVSYDLSGTINDISHFRDTASAGGTFGVNFFAPNVLFTATGFATSGSAESGGARLDTSLEFDDPSLPRRIVFGDAITDSLSWSRALRFGGLEIASDYSLRPDLITFPLPSFFDRASVLETVDVLVGAAKVFEQDIDAGPFALHDLPVVTGGGNATVVTTDVLGRETAQTVSLYTTTQLLASGLTDYGLDAGFMRYGYGEQSFDYRTPVASVVYRHGLDDFTIGAHAEAAPDLALGGGEVAFSLGEFGALSAAAAFSRIAAGNGKLGALNLQARAGAINGFASIEATTSHYQDAAGIEDGAPPRLRLQAGASTALPYGSLGLSWVRESENEQGENNELIASYSLSAGNGWCVGLTGLRDFTGRTWAAQIFLAIPVGGGIASASYSGGTGRAAALVQFNAPADPDGGFGYSAVAGTDGAGQRLEGDATWIAQHGTLDGGVAINDGEAAMRAGASGALVFVGNELFATRQPDGALALMQAGEPDVRIYRDNRQVALSDDDGEALLTGLVPYTENRIAVDPRDYPMASVVARSERIVVPQRSSVVIADLAPHRRHPALVVVRLPDGGAPPTGTIVTQSLSKDTLIVGRDGEIFLPDLSDDEDLLLAIGSETCVLHVGSPVKVPQHIPRIGPLICRPGAPA
jgi:outer membrane usher protein